MHDLLPSAMTE